MQGYERMFGSNSFQSLRMITEKVLSPLREVKERGTRRREEDGRKRRGYRNMVMEEEM